MPKATLEFNLPEENEEFRMASRCSDYYLCLWDIYNVFRSKLKYEDLDEKEYDMYDEFRKKFVEILEDHDVILD